MKKRIFQYVFMFIVCFTFIFIFTPNESSAAAEDWTYNAQAQTLTNGDGTIINNVTADGTNLSIGGNREGSFTTLDLTGEIKDSSNNTYTITSINSQGFYKCSFLTQIKLPSTLTSIGDSAFEECVMLNEIEIPDSVPQWVDGYLKIVKCFKK